MESPGILKCLKGINPEKLLPVTEGTVVEKLIMGLYCRFAIFFLNLSNVWIIPIFPNTNKDFVQMQEARKLNKNFTQIRTEAVYVVVQFYPWFIFFNFPLFFVM